MRLFLAVELPEAWLEALGRLMDGMKAALARDPLTREARLRWVRPEGIHVTLKFLGQVSVSRLNAIELAMADAVSVAPGCRLEIGEPGAFGRPPRVMWIGVAGQTRELAELAGRIDAALAPVGFEREKRPFAAHLTLARLPDDLAPDLRERVTTIATGFTVPAIASLAVEKVSLMRSHLGPGGARYERLASFPQ